MSSELTENTADVCCTPSIN